MTTYKKTSGVWKLALTLSLLGILAGCSNDSSETTRNPVTPARQLGPMEVEMLEVAAKGNNARVKELLDKGVDVNMRGNDRNTPLMEAAYAGHMDTVKLLLDHGADLSAKKNDGATPSGLAGRTKDIVDLFKNVSALVDAATNGNAQRLKELMDKGTPVNGLDEFGNSALTAASYGGKTEAVKLLLEKGANPNIEKADGETPLSLATAMKHTEIVALVNAAIAKQPKVTTTPLAARGTPVAK
jgi:ankyrin repeat protein